MGLSDQGKATLTEPCPTRSGVGHGAISSRPVRKVSDYGRLIASENLVVTGLLRAYSLETTRYLKEIKHL